MILILESNGNALQDRLRWLTAMERREIQSRDGMPAHRVEIRLNIRTSKNDLIAWIHWFDTSTVGTHVREFVFVAGCLIDVLPSDTYQIQT